MGDRLCDAAWRDLIYCRLDPIRNRRAATLTQPPARSAPPWRSGLPIDAAIPRLCEALADAGSAVLQAPPGTGKSTVVPLALLDEPWARGKRVIMLEPRRLAARAVAQRMAATLGEPVGRTVGYRMRFETRVSRDTRLEVMTEGVLTRLLQRDPALEGVAIVVLDEFHERSLQADLALALLLDSRAAVAPNLRLLAMSATLDAPRVARVLGNAPVLSVAGRAHAVQSRFVGRGAPLLAPAGPGQGEAETIERLTTRVVLRALSEERGDVLVFLPGAREIRRVQGQLVEASPDATVAVRPLYGELPASAQDAALAASPAGTRRVVLSTNIAETSLTVEGVRVVVDAGLARRLIHDPTTGLSRLVTRRISRAAAVQRQGRAGRLAPGVCLRLWSEEAHRTLAASTPAEILEADLAPLALELAVWGVRDATELQWIDPPPPALFASARDLLVRLGALDLKGRATARGREMARLGVHPRLAHLLLEGRARGELELACELAALLSERGGVAAGRGTEDTDVRTRLEGLHRVAGTVGHEDVIARRVRRAARQFARQLGGSASDSAPDAPAHARPEGTASAGILLALAYPDRVGLRRAGHAGEYVLANGRGALFEGPQRLARQELIVALDVEDSDRNARIRLAAALERAELEHAFAEQLAVNRSIAWCEREAAVIAEETVTLGALVLARKPLRDVPAEALRAALLSGMRRLGLECLPWSREARTLRARVQLVRTLEEDGEDAGLADLSDAALLATLEHWLGPWLEGVTRREHLARVPLVEALGVLIGWAARRRLDALAPTHLVVPSGSRIGIDYLDQHAPIVAVRLQELFGLTASPRIANGRLPVTFKLLSPAQRPVQITRDLASFWRGAYAEVRKDLRGRYPKHYWPEDPLEAAPTRRAKPRK